jgi:hypothetical protein
MSAIAQLDALERALIAAGFPAMSAWWRATIERFYQSGRRQCVLRVGRRGGKSSTLCRVGVLDALYGDHTIPPGDVGIVGIVSVSRDEASQRLRTVKAILDALGVAYRPIDGGIELVHRPIAFKVFTASVAGVVGGTWIVGICDEVSRWRDVDTGANPAKEVLGSLRPALAGQRSAKLFLSSAPLGNDDAHARAFDEGETAFQITAFAETWVARPELTLAETHELEPDPRVWAREYAAQPQGAVSACFEAEWVDECHERLRDPYVRCSKVVYCIDAADLDGSENCEYAGCVAHWVERRRLPEDLYEWTEHKYGDRDPDHPWADKVSGKSPKKDDGGAYILKPGLDAPPILVIEGVWGVRARAISIDAVHDHIARQCARYGARTVTGDQHDAFANTGGLARRGVTFAKRAWNQPNKTAAVGQLRRLFLDGRLLIDCDCAEDDWAILRHQLLSYQERIVNGGFTYKAKAGVLSDRASLLVVAMLASMTVGTEGSLYGNGDPVGAPAKARGSVEIPIGNPGFFAK